MPVKVVGVGEAADDLVAFDPDEFVAALFDVERRADVASHSRCSTPSPTVSTASSQRCAAAGS